MKRKIPGPIKFKFEKPMEWAEWKRDYVPNLFYAKKLRIPHVPSLEPHDGTAIIVGAAPGVDRYFDEIKAAGDAHEFNIIMSLNAAHRWLVRKGRPPNIHVISEFTLENALIALGGEPHTKTTYYVASCCKPLVFKQLEGYSRVLYHMYVPFQGYQQYIAKLFPNEFMVASNMVTFPKSLAMAIVLGYRKFELYGVGSSFNGRNTHMRDYAMNNQEKVIRVWSKRPDGSRKAFKTTPGLSFQAYDFMKFCEYNQPALKIRIHGNGLLRDLHESCYPEQYKD
jgi:hypothetical protein